MTIQPLMNDLPFPPLERVVESTIPREDDGCTLLDYLCRRYDYLKEPQWLEQLALGNLELNGVTAGASKRLAAGDRLFFQALGLREQEVSWNISIVERTPDYIIVNKPGNLPCHPAGRFFNHTLWAWLKQKAGMSSIHFVNRLDRETSGLVLIGCNPVFAAQAAKYLHAHGDASRKTYLVMVHGHTPGTPFTADGWIGLAPDAKVAKKRLFVPICNDGDSDDILAPEDPDAQPCCTDFVPRGTYTFDKVSGKFRSDPNGDLTLLEAILRTGRIHQIRATLCSLGYPVVGDKLYGLDEQLFLKFAYAELEEEDKRRLILPHQALHAWKLEIPALGIRAQCPVPWLE